MNAKATAGFGSTSASSFYPGAEIIVSKRDITINGTTYTFVTNVELL